MRFHFSTQPATFLARPNRFRIEAVLKHDGQTIAAHCPDPGRLLELLIPDVTVHVSPAHNPERKTAWDLRFVEHPAHGQLISLDSRLPNELFAEGLAAEFFAPFAGARQIEREVPVDLAHDAAAYAVASTTVCSMALDAPPGSKSNRRRWLKTVGPTFPMQ